MKRFNFFGMIVSLSFLGFIVSCSNSTSLNTDEDVSTSDNSIDVIVLAGQSNAAGVPLCADLQSYVSDETFELFSNGCGNVGIASLMDWSIYDRADEVIEMSMVQFGQGSSKERFGLEIGLAYMAVTSKKNVFIIKYTSPGNVIEYFINGSGIASEFKQFIQNSLLQVRLKGYLPQVKALCWMQGECDCNAYTNAIMYEKRLEFLVESFRDEYGQDVIFVDAPITDWGLVQPVHYQSLVNEAKQKFALSDSRNFIIDSTGLQKMEFDQAHYDAKSEFEIGVRMGKILQSAY
jgi:hypothetical protein